MTEKMGSGKIISVQDWEQMMQDFRTSSDLQQKWLTIWPGLALLEQALLIIMKKEVPIKSQLLVFIEENTDVLIESDVEAGFGMILEALTPILQSPNDGVIVTSTTRENMMVMATSVAIVTDTLHTARGKLEGLVELFLVFINRPNYSSDRHVRGLACECLRELEMAYPCLLYGCVGHIHYLSMHEKTHANQSYTLLLTTIVENLSCRMYTTRSKSANYLPILQSTAPLVPFSVPFFLVSSIPGEESRSIPTRDLTSGNLKEFRTVVAFILERPQLFTTVGMVELVSSVIKISKALDLPGQTMKTHFSSIFHSYSPVLCHIVLLIYTHFMESVDDAEGAILKRLISLSRDESQPLPFRLLGVHWLLGVEILHLRTKKKSVIAPFARGLYPVVFDPLSLKATKLGALAHCAVALDQQGRLSQGNGSLANGSAYSAVVLLNEGFLSISSYNWLPPWSTETQLAFHIFHRFLTVAIPHLTRARKPDQVGFRDSPLFETLQKIFVTMAVQMRKLVPNVVALLDRLMGCDVHRALGEELLRNFNEEMLPQLQPDRRLASYFPLLEKIAENSEIPPGALIRKLTVYMRQRVEENDGDEDWMLWSRSSEVLGICRTVLLGYRSSRVFHGLAELLGFLCRFLPDIEGRDTARLYLRMLISIPGKKLRDVLKYGNERVEEANAPQISQVSSLLQSPTSASHRGTKQTWPVASYIYLMRVRPLLVRHSWSLVLFNAFASGVEAAGENIDLLGNSGMATGPREHVDHDEPDSWVGSSPNPSLRVMDAQTSEIISLLRRHFTEIPDYVNGAGLKIPIPCTLRFLGETLQKFAGEMASVSWNFPDSWPAIYAVVVTFATSGFYGPIQNVRVPLLLSDRPERNWQKSGESSTPSFSNNIDIKGSDHKGKGKYYVEDMWDSERQSAIEVPKQTGLVERDPTGEEVQMFHEIVIVELEPKQPVPTLLDVHIEFSDEEGQGVQGQLDSIPVGIEDLFVKPPVPSDVLSDNRTDYLLNLFDALWEACSGPGRLGTESFSLKNTLVNVSVQGAQSVKLLEAQADRVIAAVEHSLAHFVVAVSGGPLVNIAKDAGLFQEVKWLVDEASFRASVASEMDLRSSFSRRSTSDSSLQIQLRDPAFSPPEELSKSGLGSFLLLILLPPCYHLLLRMEVADESTLVRIRTDHWPCLAHVDEYLEALTMAG